MLGFFTGLGVWLGTAHALYGEVTIKSTGGIVPCVWGTVCSTFSPIPYSLIITAIKPENFDWADFRKERLAFDVDTAATTDDALVQELQNEDVHSQKYLKRWGRVAAFWALATFFGHWVLWPLPMYAAHYIFSKAVSNQQSSQSQAPARTQSTSFVSVFSHHPTSSDTRMRSNSSSAPGSSSPSSGCGSRSSSSASTR